MKDRKDFLPRETLENSAAMLRAIDEMPWDVRAVFFMRWMDDMDIDEIALAMAISARAARA
ncbi:MAG: sigma-70 region 4 domain-containing protein, partial [Clostridiales Family XIII bacterium]|nr:sigma-70 region 4 domain-containing protein [Clostridiales Family XIII bacterium]